MKVALSLFLDLFRRFPFQFLALFGMVFMQAMLNAMSVVAIAPVTDFLLGRTAQEYSAVTLYCDQILGAAGIELTLMVAFVFFSSVITVIAVAGTATEYAVLRMKYDVLIHLLADTLEQFFNARYLFFSQSDMGMLLNSFQQEVSKIGDTFGNIARFFANVFQALIFLAVPFSINSKLTLMFVVGALIMSSPLWLVHRVIYDLGRKNTQTGNIASGVLHESLTAAKLVLGFGRQAATVRRYQKSMEDHADVTVKFQTIKTGIYKLMQPAGVASAMVAVYWSYQDGVPLSEIAMVLFALTRLLPVLGELLQGKTSIQGFLPAYEQLDNLRKTASSMKEPKATLEFKKISEKLQFQQVTFRYPNMTEALKNITLTIPKGNSVAFVGRSGAGKTTLVDLLLGLYDCESGCILMDGNDLNTFNLDSYRRRVGYVPQEAQLFNMSIKENMLWANPKASDSDIWRVCDMANATEFINKLPDKLDTALGDRGVRLSGGQRQRLALARAIIRNPDLLILDEATSALDTASERLIQQSIDLLARKMTIIIVAHRLSTIKNVDYVCVLDDGCLVESGSYKELSESQDSIFSTMVKEQLV